jgi:hypothetical protein
MAFQQRRNSYTTGTIHSIHYDFEFTFFVPDQTFYQAVKVRNGIDMPFQCGINQESLCQGGFTSLNSKLLFSANK